MAEETKSEVPALGGLPTAETSDPQTVAVQPKADATLEGKKALYILQITRSKFSEESMKVLKCLLLHILRTTKMQHIVIEVYFDMEEFSPLDAHLELILKMLVTGYNLTEPEHSRTFPLVKIDILWP